MRVTAIVVAVVIAVSGANSVRAQQPAKPAVQLPSIEVVGAQKKKAAAKKVAPKKQPAKAVPQDQPALVPQADADPAGTQDARDHREAYGPVDGLVAKQSGVGTKTATPITQIPQTVNVVTRDELNQRDVQDLNTAVGYTPGVRIIDYPGGQGSPDIYLRGFRSINFLGLYRDGLRGGFNTYDTNLEMYGVERVDVVKGPASVLYGQSPPGGLINLISKRPRDDFFNEVAVQYGSFDRKQTMFDFGGATAGGGALFRFNGLVRDSDTQIDHMEDDRVYLAPSLTLRPTESTSLTLYGEYLDVRRGGSEQSVPIYGTVLPNTNGKIKRGLFLGEPDWNKEDVESYTAGYELTHKFSPGLIFRSIGRYTDAEASFDTIGIRVTAFDDNDTSIGRIAQDRDQTSELYQTDNNVEANFSTGFIRHKLLAGFDYSDYHRDEARRNGLPSDLNVFDPVYGQPIVWLPGLAFVSSITDSQQAGLYIQDQARIGDLILTGGLRYDRSETAIDFFVFGAEVAREDEAFTWRGGVAYEFANGVTPFFSYSTSFLPQTLPRVGFSVLDPNEGEQYEAGIKFQPPGTSSLFQIAVFDITQTNLPSTDALGGLFYEQVGEVNSKGIEVEGKTEIMRNLDLVASYTYNDAFITKDDSSFGPNRQGNRFNAVPEHMASLWLNYRFPAGPFAGLQTGAGVRYIGETTDQDNKNTIPDYALVDAVVSYEMGYLTPAMKGAKLTVSATNLFDKEYYTPGFYTDFVKEGNERAVLGTLSYRW